MKKLQLIFGIYIAFFVFGLLIAPIFAISQPYTNFDAADNVDDVYYDIYEDLEEPKGQGDHADGVDIVSVNLTGGNIVVNFQGDDPNRSGWNYHFWLDIDIDNDGNSDYRINYYFGAADNYSLLNNIVGHANYTKHWDGSGKNWTNEVVYIIGLDIGNTVTLSDVELALNANGHALTNSKFSLYVKNKNASNYWFIDYIPEPSSGGIPGFHLISILFSLATLISIVTIYKYKRL